MAACTRRIAGSLKRGEYERCLPEAGLQKVAIRESHRVDEHAASAIIRAMKRESHRVDEHAASAIIRAMKPA